MSVAVPPNAVATKRDKLFLNTVARLNPQDHSREFVAAALRRFQPQLQAFVRSRVPSELVDDVLQSAALRAIERAGSLRDPQRALAWLYRIHRNIIIDGARSQASRNRALDQLAAQEAPADSSIKDSTCACSLHLARTLPSNYAQILELVDIGSLGLAQAAQQLGITANNAGVRLHRARKALVQTMQEHCGVRSLRDCADCRCVDEGCCPT